MQQSMVQGSSAGQSDRSWGCSTEAMPQERVAWQRWRAKRSSSRKAVLEPQPFSNAALGSCSALWRGTAVRQNGAAGRLAGWVHARSGASAIPHEVCFRKAAAHVHHVRLSIQRTIFPRFVAQWQFCQAMRALWQMLEAQL